jgi:CMP-N,N'-diacetyllegionaminic acid synthase
MEILAIVPARGGSKGLPNKNILPLNGHPLLAYSVVAGLKTPEITRVICSTDSDDIAKIALEYGAEVPFMRPSELARDHSNDFDTFYHALKWLEKNDNYVPDIVIQLRPTSPIRFMSDIQNAISFLINNTRIDSVRAVSEPATTPYKMWNMGQDNLLLPLLTLPGNIEPFNTARQDLPEVWSQTGALEVIRTTTILNKGSMTGDNIFGLKVDPTTYVDIDTLNSLLLAEIVMKDIECIKP